MCDNLNRRGKKGIKNQWKNKNLWGRGNAQFKVVMAEATQEKKRVILP